MHDEINYSLYRFSQLLTSRMSCPGHWRRRRRPVFFGRRKRYTVKKKRVTFSRGDSINDQAFSPSRDRPLVHNVAFSHLQDGIFEEIIAREADRYHD
jgi:hypothetical protein